MQDINVQSRDANSEQYKPHVKTRKLFSLDNSHNTQVLTWSVPSLLLSGCRRLLRVISIEVVLGEQVVAQHVLGRVALLTYLTAELLGGSFGGGLGGVSVAIVRVESRDVSAALVADLTLHTARLILQEHKPDAVE